MKQIKTMSALTHLALIMWVCRSNLIVIFCNSDFFSISAAKQHTVIRRPKSLLVYSS